MELVNNTMLMNEFFKIPDKLSAECLYSTLHGTSLVMVVATSARTTSVHTINFGPHKLKVSSSLGAPDALRDE